MLRKLLLVGATLLMVAPFAVNVYAEGLELRRHDPYQTQRKLPTEMEGKLIVYEIGDIQCSLFINETGMSKGASSVSCVKLDKAPDDNRLFRILAVIPAQGE